jgi:hypothetical protein
MRLWLPVLLAACSGPPEVRERPCYARDRIVPLDEVSELGFAPIDATGRYAALFVDASGTTRSVDVRLSKPVHGWIRDVVREPAFGFVETPACDVRVGVEVDVALETGDRWFVENLHAAAVMTAFQDAWLVRALRPLHAVEGDFPQHRPPEACDDVDVRFDLNLEGGETGGRIVETTPGQVAEGGPCFREVLAWDR